MFLAVSPQNRCEGPDVRVSVLLWGLGSRGACPAERWLQGPPGSDRSLSLLLTSVELPQLITSLSAYNSNHIFNDVVLMVTLHLFRNVPHSQSCSSCTLFFTGQSWIIFSCNLPPLSVHVAMETITECLCFASSGINYRPLRLRCDFPGKSAAFSPVKGVPPAINSKRI